MNFTKLHGAGNDYVVIYGLDESVPEEASCLAIAMCHRRTGVGADGLIVILPSQSADARMRIFNPDGSEAEMCGNGLRCVAKFLYDRSFVRERLMRIETGRGVLTVQVEERQRRVERARINMGHPVFERNSIPTTLTGDPPVNVRVEAAGDTWSVTCLSMGNPHCVVFPEQITDDLVCRAGRALERHPAFPNRTNVEFVQVLSRNELSVRIWERGVGETLACGTGACAALVASALTGRTDRKASVQMPGGILDVDWADSQDVFLTGPAVEVFSGTWPDQF